MHQYRGDPLVDLAVDHTLWPAVDALKWTVEAKRICVVVPEPVEAAFDRLSGGIQAGRIKAHLKSYKRYIEAVLALLAIEPDDKDQESTEAVLGKILRRLDGLQGNIDTHLQAVKTRFAIVKHLLDAPGTKHVPTTDAMLARAGRRIRDKRAPCHTHPDINDALILEAFVEHLDAAAPDTESYFVTRDTTHFCADDRESAHPDLAGVFKRRGAHFSISIGDVPLVRDAVAPATVRWEKDMAVPMIVWDKRPAYPNDPLICPECGQGRMRDAGWRPSPGGGHTYQLRCMICGLHYDTGEYLDG